MIPEMKDINLDSDFGDFVIEGDLRFINNTKVLEAILNERVKTSFGDFRLNKSLGADLTRFVGVGITDQLVEDMSVALVDAITFDGLVPTQDVSVLPLRIGKNRIYFRVIVMDPYNKGQEITVTQLYNNEGN